MRAMVVGVLVCATLPGQEFRGTFSGTFTDAQGAGIARVRIVATEIRTAAKSETYSEASGAYTIPFLAPASNVQLADNIRTFHTQFGNLRRDASKNIDLSLGKILRSPNAVICSSGSSRSTLLTG